MRKGAVAVLALVLALAVAGVASAAPHGQGSEKGKAGRGAKVKLHDVRGHWAEESMVTLNLAGVIRGYEDATFRPEAAIKKEEAITLLVRALGWSAEDVTVPPEVRAARQVDPWAWPYLACAVENGLITEDELAGFLGNQPAKRYEVAVWLARALDLEGDAEAVTGFADVAAIPSEAAALVGAAVREGILVGYPDRTFQPNKPIKRAEMATLLMRVLPWLPARDFAVHWGTVAEVAYDTDKPTITLVERWWPRFPFIMKHKAKAFIWPPLQQKVTLPVAEDALVYVDGQRAELSDVALGSWAVVLVDPSGEAVLIAARSRPALKAEEVVTGKVEAVTTVDEATTLKVRLSGGQVA
ncbi:MAG: S-layer homology domain-containing protein, partial [Firmicutes bacterium]|nr:S-layer homology domain-containing protein [Bacillota bacterium]